MDRHKRRGVRDEQNLEICGKLDTIEFYAIARAMEVDPVVLFRVLAEKLPRDVDI